MKKGDRVQCLTVPKNMGLLRFKNLDKLKKGAAYTVCYAKTIRGLKFISLDEIHWAVYLPVSCFIKLDLDFVNQVLRKISKSWYGI